MSFYVVGTAIVVSFHLNRSSHFGDGHFRSDEHFHCFLSNLQTVRQLPQRKKKKKIKVFKHDVTRGTMCNEVLIRNSITVSHTLCFHRVVHWSFIVVNAIRFYGVDLEMLQILANPSREFSFFDYHLLLKKKSFELRVFVVSIASLSTELSPLIYHYFQFLFEYLWHMTDTLKIRNRDNRYVCEPFYIGVRLCNRNIRDVSR